MTPLLHMDCESRGTLDLRVVGLYNYARHRDTALWCLSYAFDDEPIERWIPGQKMSKRIIRFLDRGEGRVIAHNVAFEIAMWNYQIAMKQGMDCPAIDPEQTECTMAMAYAMALPGDLAQAAMAAGLAEDKDQKGRALMLQMCRPRAIKDGVITWWDDEARQERLRQYCDRDVEVARALHKRLRPLNPNERRIWLMDYRINARGVRVDVAACEKAIVLTDVAKIALDEKMFQITCGAVRKCTGVADLTAWLAGMGVACEGVAKDDITKMLTTNSRGPVAEALKLRQEAGRSSTAKLKKMIESLSPGDFRLRGMFQYHGTGTGAWSGRKVQLQNLPRPTLPPELIDAAFEYLDDGALMELMSAPVMTAVPNMLRGMLVAAPGHDLISADMTAVQSRILAWLAGAERKLDLFRGGECVYCDAAEKIYGHVVTKKTHPELRQVGKVSELAFGFGGGVGSGQTMAKNNNVDITDAQIESNKVIWRHTNPEIVQYWYDLEAAAVKAIRFVGDEFSAGATGRQVRFVVKGSFLWCRLPSGRCLCFPYPSMAPKMMWWGEVKQCISFKGVDSTTRRWTTQWTYGGSLAQNITHATNRDLLAEAMLRMEAAGYPVVLHCHDEAVSEVAEGFGSVQEYERLLCELPSWAVGLPVAAEGWRAKRYRK